MKLPNGYGSVYKLKGNRRKPWAARKTVGWKDNGQPIYVFVGYYQTRGEALQSLSEFNGYELSSSPSKTTLALVYSACEDTLTSNYRGTWKYFDEIKDVPMSDITLKRLQAIFDRCGAPQTTQENMKILLRKLYTYAVHHELVRPEKAEILRWIEIRAKKSRTVERKIFTPDEIKALWKQVKTDKYASIPLILIYTGLRIDELLSLRMEDVDEDLHIRRAKTSSGIRDVPICDKIKPLVDMWKDDSLTLITTPKGVPMSYSNMRHLYWKVDHTPHDTRHTCASMLAERGVDPRMVRAILGHKGVDLAEDTYTHISREAKLEALNLL